MTSRSPIARVVFLGLAIGCCAAAGVGQGANNAPAQISISAEKPVTVAGDAILVDIDLKITSDHTIGMAWPPIFPRGTDNYDFHIHAENGSILKAMPLPAWAPRPQEDPQFFPIAMGPGEKQPILICLSCVFDMSAPGVYKAYASQVFLDREKPVTVKSNEIEIRVVPRPPGAAPNAGKLTIEIAPRTTMDTYGAAVSFDVNLTNNTNHEVDSGDEWEGTYNFTYRFDILGADGKRIMAWEEMPNHGSAGESKMATLLPGESKKWEQGLAPRNFPGLVTGTYTVRMSIPDPDDRSKRVYSNAVALTIQPAPQQEEKPAVELILSPDNITVAPNSDLVLSLRWTNHSRERQFWGSLGYSTGIIESYLYDIRTSDGKPVPRIPGMEKEKAFTYPSTGQEGGAVLMPGESVDTVVPGLMQAFQMNSPGAYTIQISLPNPDHLSQLLGTSNKVTVTVVPKEQGAPQTAGIKRFFIEEANKNSTYETGPLHILYDDGTEIVETLPPLRVSTDQKTVFNDVGFSDVQLAADRQTLGWTVDVQNCCTSYPVPLRVVVLRHKQVLHTFGEGLMVWSYIFLQGGDQLAVVFGPTHGPEVGAYRLYDVLTGKLISEVVGDEGTQSLRPDAPEWAKLLQERLHNK